MRRANRLVFDDVATSGLYATAFVARFDRREGVLRYASAGHQLPVHWSAAGRAFASHGEGGLPLGLLEDGAPPEAATPFGEGDIFLSYTDGVVEATNAEGEAFGRHRLLGIVHRSRRRGARAILRRIWRELEAFLDGAPLADDASIAVVRARAGFGAPRCRRETPTRASSAAAPLAAARTEDSEPSPPATEREPAPCSAGPSR
jgi:sigma-B regulation protein RsbU (phosphoserine phosphatase)